MHAAGFTESQKRDACWYLECVVRELHERRSVQKTLLIRQARIPIAKVPLWLHALTHVAPKMRDVERERDFEV